MKKLICGTTLIIVSIYLIISSNYYDHKHITTYNDGHVTIDIDKFKRIVKIDSDKIVPLIYLNTKACSPCLNNVHDFIDIMKGNDIFKDPVILFINENEYNIIRFLGLSGLSNIKYINSEDAMNNIHGQRILFVHKSNILYIYSIPNNLITMSEKEAVIKEVVNAQQEDA